MQNGFQTLKSQVYQTLRREILAGVTPPGARLVRRVLSKRLGVSPIPVIEALHQLEQDGLVESEPMFGHRVRLLNLEAVRNDHIMREAIECQSARLCAQNASADEFATLARQAEELDKLPVSEHDSSVHADEHLEFHLGIARLTGYASLAKALENLWFRRLMVINTVNAALMGVPASWHRQLVKALASRDPEIAEKAMRKHVQFNVDLQLKKLEETWTRAISTRANGAPASGSAGKPTRAKRGRPPAR
jgi:DNA-binding GntR family transcriptional regulator